MTTKTELTPERLTKMIGALPFALDANLPHDAADEIAEALRYLAEILRVAQPVYQVVIHVDPDGKNHWADCSESFYKAFQPDDVKRILYTRPQPDNRDARIAELEKEVAEYKRTIAEYELKERNVLASRGIV